MDQQDTQAERLEQLVRQREQRPNSLQPFGTLTWRRSVLSVVTYGLFLTDVLRTGLGVRQLELASVNPDVRVLFGPYNYPVVHLTTANASLPTSSQRFWSYKYDSTSLTMRAVAKTLGLSTWSPARQCDRGATNCSTIAVDDYRYEAAVLAATEREWFTIVAMLRGTGQAYAWLRVASLVAGIVAAENRASTSRTKKVRVALRTFLIIPSHVVVYGSIIPVMCYAAAHALDSSIVYEQIRKDFNALRGFVNFTFGKFISLATVSMRTVWVIALVCHAVTWLSTKRSWSPSLGVMGVPELFIALISSSTVLAHYRFSSWRDCRIMQIHEIPSSQRLRDIRALSFDTTRGAINKLVLGTTSDFQFVSLAFATVSGIVFLACVAERTLGSSLRHRLTVITHTRVPYSSPWLWPTDALVINWANSVTKPVQAQHHCQQPKSEEGQQRLFVESEKNPLKKETPVQRKTSQRLTISVRPLQRYNSVSDSLQDPLLEIDHRTRGVAAFISTLNLTVMSDPVLYLRLQRGHSSQLVGLFECIDTGKLWLLPLPLSMDSLDVPVDWERLQRVAIFKMNELSWCDLLNCG
ncbi:hypothetical protein P43SY_010506 [Pythium insidiosum]|uniref:Transmembrane protein n=1 Tax=Pythium insidiosum TaxID=114742 RepID=A0AAD5L6I7_PYTIN|nr:hypothetical protein P43SY_010506 [Pythium insidiosum]